MRYIVEAGDLFNDLSAECGPYDIYIADADVVQMFLIWKFFATNNYPDHQSSIQSMVRTFFITNSRKNGFIVEVINDEIILSKQEDILTFIPDDAVINILNILEKICGILSIKANLLKDMDMIEKFEIDRDKQIIIFYLKDG